jgi:hypothetical protein
MSFALAELHERHLAGGALSDLVGALMVPEEAWAKHVAKLKKGDGAKTVAHLASALGHAIPAELAEWLDLEGPAGTPEPNDAGWWIRCNVPRPKKGQADVALLENPLLFLTGLLHFADEASGDQALLSVRPHPLDVAEVYAFDHEVGALDGVAGHSIADFVVAKWAPEKSPPKIAAARKAFAKRAEKALAKRPKHLGPEGLWSRSQWLFGLLAGEPGFRFPEMLARAPTLADWKKEQSTLADEPELAVQWMLTHLFFADDDAVRIAIAQAKKSAGRAIVEIASTLEAFLDGKRETPLGALSGDALAKARALVAKNALPTQTKKRAKRGPVRDASADVDAADAALRELAARDAKMQKLVDAYFRERTQEAYNHWPHRATLPDEMLAHVAIAFRAGLAVDLGHPRAFAGVSRALAERVDHPAAREAMIAALGTLAPDDDRLGHAMKALLACSEPEAKEAIRKAAWRWLDHAMAIGEVLEKRRARNSLDDVFAKDDLLKPAVSTILERGDEEAEKLALAIREKQLGFPVLGRVAGMIFRVYGLRGIRDRIDRMQTFLAFLDEVPGAKGEEKGVALDDTAAVAMSQCALALARLEPEATKKTLKAMLTRKRLTDERRAGVAACLLAASLHLDPKDADALAWLERILGARGGPPWIYGALLAAREAKITRAIPWILPHAYARSLNEMMSSFAAMEADARQTLAALGAPAPPFDEEDKFARDVATRELGAALLRHDRYDHGAVLDRIAETKSAEAQARSIAAFLGERFRFSKYEPESHFIADDLGKAVALLKKAGAPGAEELARLGKLPQLGAWARGMLR